MMARKSIRLSLPAWLLEAEQRYSDTGKDRDRMRWVLALAERNINERSGGPFAAAVFDARGLIAAGVNRVLPGHCSSAHAEIVTLSLAQQRIGHHDLGAATAPGMTLYSSTEPCAMCLGALCWSGIARVVTSATGADAEAIGFDEGPKPADWQTALTDRGILVTDRLLITAGRKVLKHYKNSGGIIYNGRSTHNTRRDE